MEFLALYQQVVVECYTGYMFLMVHLHKLISLTLLWMLWKWLILPLGCCHPIWTGLVLRGRYLLDIWCIWLEMCINLCIQWLCTMVHTRLVIWEGIGWKLTWWMGAVLTFILSGMQERTWSRMIRGSWSDQWTIKILVRLIRLQTVWSVSLMGRSRN